MAFITARDVKHKFFRRDESGQVTGEIFALDGIDLEVEAGQFIAILGHNGSGKSTFAKHLNALLTPSEGTLYVDGKNVSDAAQLWNVRQSAGMIFQNPDNQIVAGVVEEDVAFGPENMGIPTEEICTRVDESLAAVRMTEYRNHSPNRLSGGQKQRVAVAGVVAMRPKCILMDEATAMLDPTGRREVLQTVHKLHREEKVTVILITHYMEEAADADYVFVLDRGKVVMQGVPREIFSQAETLLGYGLDIPQITRLAHELQKEGYDLPAGVLHRKELADALCDLHESKKAKNGVLQTEAKTAVGIDSAEVTRTKSVAQTAEQKNKPVKMELCDVSYQYSTGTAYERKALNQINLTVYEEDFIGIIGHTGSGKSTLIQLFNGLLHPTSGRVLYEGKNLADSGFSLRELRGKVGLVFQYAEHQLFETTVQRDVAFGPKNQGLGEAEAMERAKKALQLVNLPEECWEMSPFELSGGQKRRAAIAGVIAMEPEVLVLDEPTAGLDPKGRDELFALIRGLHEKQHMTILLVSHSMEDVADYVNRIVVLKGGNILMEGTPHQVFARAKELEEASLAAPQVTYLVEELRARGCPVASVATTLAEAKEVIQQLC